MEDENGEIVREVMKDSDSINLYKSMRETLIFLTHLDYEDTQEIMLNKLAAQVYKEERKREEWRGIERGRGDRRGRERRE